MILASKEEIAAHTQAGWWGTETIDARFRANAAATPGHLAVADPPNRMDIDGREPRRLAYRDLSAEADRIATAFLDAGLKKDDVVAVQLPNVVELVAVYLGAWRAGLIVTPAPVQWRAHELGDVLNFVGAKAAVTARSIRGHDHAAMFESLKQKLPALRKLFVIGETEWPAADNARLDALPKADANDAATICWTSGTEARPKGVPRSHNHWMIAGLACADAAQLQPGDTVLNPFPLVNMAAIGGCFMPWLLTGGTLVQHHPFDLPVFLKQLVGEKIAYTVAPPAVLSLLLKEEKLMASLDLSAVRSIGSGSAPLAPWMVKTWQEQYGLPIVNIFGSNEGTCLISGAGDVPDPEERAQFFPRFGVKGFDWPAKIAGSIETKLIDLQSGEEITESGKPGELLIKGATVFAGYYRAGDGGGPADAIDKDGFFHTGDVFEIAGAGNRYYRFVERAKDIIIRGGMNISPGEIDGLLAGMPKIREAAVVGYADGVMGERICAVAVPAEGESVTLEDVRAHLMKSDIAAYKLPERLELAEALPRNPLGKVLRRQLREMIGG
ncbi:class I adenylate-forming enzyme family protein [Parvibaculum sp.]|uniref:class I adenylate-forming enzyme family protein n=1 Tax=Parvibaculum sp. TaxID=2024848 RepID=UPI00272F6660|nr:class I adenylate-forming enzyme family protein [Parvibaculum sp.]MDP1628056.1 class I adenylate-forming enzyme family protein [Parvibaculum sp.]MDP2151055.1 class I adenylate-forming enzyme family protein [Parvibaculum sp.]MDP3328522.1 class I adenylate-forming enzyme family protein [Parvibaculum sp.]